MLTTRLVVVVDRDWFQIFGFEDLSTGQATNVVDSIPASDHLGSAVRTPGLHNKKISTLYSREPGSQWLFSLWDAKMQELP
jgi:hypothetical protein